MNQLWALGLTCVRLVEYGGVGVGVRGAAVVAAAPARPLFWQGSDEALLGAVIQPTAVCRPWLILRAQWQHRGCDCGTFWLLRAVKRLNLNQNSFLFFLMSHSPTPSGAARHLCQWAEGSSSSPPQSQTLRGSCHCFVPAGSSSGAHVSVTNTRRQNTHTHTHTHIPIHPPQNPNGPSTERVFVLFLCAPYEQGCVEWARLQWKQALIHWPTMWDNNAATWALAGLSGRISPSSRTQKRSALHTCTHGTLSLGRVSTG